MGGENDEDFQQNVNLINEHKFPMFKAHNFSFDQVGHAKGYIQLLAAAPDYMLGTSVLVKITSVGIWSVFGEVIEKVNPLSDNRASSKKFPNQDISSLCCNPSKSGGCSDKPESCACGYDSCCGQNTAEESDVSREFVLPQNQNSRKFHWMDTEEAKASLKEGTERTCLIY